MPSIVDLDLRDANYLTLCHIHHKIKAFWVLEAPFGVKITVLSHGHETFPDRYSGGIAPDTIESYLQIVEERGSSTRLPVKQKGYGYRPYPF